MSPPGKVWATVVVAEAPLAVARSRPFRSPVTHTTDTSLNLATHGTRATLQHSSICVQLDTQQPDQHVAFTDGYVTCLVASAYILCEHSHAL